MKRFLLIVSFVLFLPGCHVSMVALLAIGGAAGYYYGKDHRSIGQMSTDQSISAEINTALHRQAGVNPSKVQIYTYQGRVVLEGVVQTQDAAERILDITRNTRGVKSVQSELRIISRYD